MRTLYCLAGPARVRWAPVASIPIPGGRSLSPVKNRGGRNFFLNEGFYWDSLQCNIQSRLPLIIITYCGALFIYIFRLYICLVTHWTLQLFWICYMFKTLKLLCFVLAIMICSKLHCEAKDCTILFFAITLSNIAVGKIIGVHIP